MCIGHPFDYGSLFVDPEAAPQAPNWADYDMDSDAETIPYYIDEVPVQQNDSDTDESPSMASSLHEGDSDIDETIQNTPEPQAPRGQTRRWADMEDTDDEADSTSHEAQRRRTEWEVIVCLDTRQLTVPVQQTSTVRFVRQVVNLNWHIDLDAFVLMSRDNFVTDSRTAGELGWAHGERLRIDMRPTPAFHIFIRTLAGLSVVLLVSESDTVLNLRAKCSFVTSVPRTMFSLTFNGLVLEYDGVTVGQLHIIRDDTIWMCAGLRGGMDSYCASVAVGESGDDDDDVQMSGSSTSMPNIAGLAIGSASASASAPPEPPAHPLPAVEPQPLALRGRKRRAEDHIMQQGQQSHATTPNPRVRPTAPGIRPNPEMDSHGPVLRLKMNGKMDSHWTHMD